MSSVDPAAAESALVEQPELIPPLLRTLGSALMAEESETRRALDAWVSALARHHAMRAARQPPGDTLRTLVAMLVIDPWRYQQDAAFRLRIGELLPKTLDTSVPVRIREGSLRELNAAIGIDFDTAEALAAAWGLVRRSSIQRRLRFTDGLQVSDDWSGSIAASIFSISTEFSSYGEARRFLAAVHDAAPGRSIVVLADGAMRDALRDLPVTVIDTHSRPFTPWPRDPFLAARSKEGLVLVNRPNLQPGREEDANMVRTLLQQLPDASPWKDASWTTAPIPFHNGHVLLTSGAAWISIHTVEIRALEILGLDRVPVGTFGDEAGIERYLTAVRQAARELEGLYGRPVRFVHPLAADPALMSMLGGGGGFDLDSLLTLLPRPDGRLTALVGDLASGARLASTSDWSGAARGWGLAGEGIGAAVAAAQKTSGNASLQAYLDTIAGHLSRSGAVVHRLPLVNVPGGMSAEGRDFLLNWNNVVIEGKRAEGFSSLLPEGDALARSMFEKAGFELVLFPPLTRSVMLNGGYRCASNHIREQHAVR